MLHADWCGPCRSLERVLLSDPKVLELLSAQVHLEKGPFSTERLRFPAPKTAVKSGMPENFGLWVIGGLAVWGLFLVLATKPTPPEVVRNFELARYLGRWYALAHIPTSFERGCAKGTTATYTLLPNGQIEVVNECFDEKGQKKVIRGRAWIPNPKEPAKLKVSFVNLFGIWLFPGDYWVIELAPDYSYAVVGHPARKYGWILSCTPNLDEAAWAKIHAALERAGYRWEQFVLIDQSPWGAKRP